MGVKERDSDEPMSRPPKSPFTAKPSSTGMSSTLDCMVLANGASSPFAGKGGCKLPSRPLFVKDSVVIISIEDCERG
jgi:hypothetical protein